MSKRGGGGSCKAGNITQQCRVRDTGGNNVGSGIQVETNNVGRDTDTGDGTA